MRHILIYEQDEDGSQGHVPYITTNSPIVVNILKTILPNGYLPVLNRMSENFCTVAIHDDRFKILLEFLEMFPNVSIEGRPYMEFVKGADIEEYLKQAFEENS